jgi:radical SAM protein with 4Fe4S-binding SPASM domain
MKTINVPSIPHLVHIETTYACNQHCLFCYNPNRNSKIDLSIIDQIVIRVYESWIPHVYLIGGEPSLLGVEKLNQYIEMLSERSSVTIVTNGQAYLDGLSTKLACIGVPVHGIETTHDYLTNKHGSFSQAVSSILKYVERGFDVRCIPVLTCMNYDQMYNIISLASKMGMESVFVDRYEDGGLGSQKSEQLKPSLDQFRTALGQMIRGRDDFDIPVGWGTAIPFCLDRRMIEQNMTADCGAGITFAAINPKGEVRTCNQSECVYGNILVEDFETIWHKPELSEFRSLQWIEKPCIGCSVLAECLCGCKVDANSAQTYSVDYAVRGDYTLTILENRVSQPREESISIPPLLRFFHLNPYTRVNTTHCEAYLVTRYQTIEIDNLSLKMLNQILGGVVSEELLIDLNANQIEIEGIRRFISLLAQVGAIDIMEEE